LKIELANECSCGESTEVSVFTYPRALSMLSASIFSEREIKVRRCLSASGKEGGREDEVKAAGPPCIRGERAAKAEEMMTPRTN